MVGETIGPQNWQKIQGMVGENLLSRIKAGYTIQIKASKVYQPLKEYVEATEKYSGKVSLGADGELLNYVAGQPFPKIDPSDPQLGQKLAWNFFYRWLGDDYKTGGAVKGGKILRVAIEKDGSERRADGFRVVGYSTPPGSAAAYYPETNVLVPLDSVADISNTPTSKSVTVRLEPVSEKAPAWAG